jgi:flagellar protein FlaG
MENKLALSATQPVDIASAKKPAPPVPETSVEPPPAPEADLRLVIEERNGTFVYKTIDRRTGEVVLQLPREDVVRMREEEGYSAGDVISAQV